VGLDSDLSPWRPFRFDVSSPATEPDWLVERRRKGASLAQELPLPDQKAKGWEFTDLSALDLDAVRA